MFQTWRVRQALLQPFILLVLGSVLVHASHREHKVHNIVLYPDKHSWCNWTAITQVVGQPGCEPVELENYVCVGGCFSYSIPRTEPHAPGEVAPYCDSCQPSATSWKHVTLKCNSGEYEGETLTKRVEIIEGCHCSSCGRHEGAADPPSHGQAQASGDVPQLLDLVYSTHNASHAHKEHIHFDPDTNHKLSVLLKRFTEEEEKGSLDEETLESILTDIKTEDQPLANNQLQEAQNKGEDSSPVSVDIVKLRHVLRRTDSHHRHHHKVGGTGGEPTLDVASHHLRPAVAGSEISYHGTREALLPHEDSETQN